jgi:hypothetical protein
MKGISGSVGIIATVTALGGCAPDACRGSDAKYYNEALAYQLAARGIPHKISGDLVCVSARNASELSAAETRVDATFNQIAHLLRDSCEEQAFVAWAEKEGLRFDVRTTLDAQRRPSRRMFLLRSFTTEELVSNAAKLARDAPKGVICNTKG